MSTPFMGELKLMSFNFAPKGWAMCNGQLLQINQNQALFSLMGTTYGGNGQTTFGLPDLRGRIPISFGNGHTQGERGGEEAHTVIMSEMPAHIHIASTDVTTNPATLAIPAAGSSLGIPSATLNTGAATTMEIYSAGSANMAAMTPATVSFTGGSQPHENRQPFLCLNWCVALQGIFPSQN